MSCTDSPKHAVSSKVKSGKHFLSVGKEMLSFHACSSTAWICVAVTQITCSRLDPLGFQCFSMKWRSWNSTPVAEIRCSEYSSNDINTMVLHGICGIRLLHKYSQFPKDWISSKELHSGSIIPNIFISLVSRKKPPQFVLNSKMPYWLSIDF